MESLTNVDLVEVDPIGEVGSVISDDIEYPCVIISGVTTEEEIRFFHNRKVKTDNGFPLFVDFQGCVKRIGEFEMTLDNMLAVKEIGNYNFKVYRTADESKDLDISDVNVLEKMISF